MMMYGRGYFGTYNHLGYGNYGLWGMIITIGVILIGILLVLYFTRTRSKSHIYDAVLEALKMKFVKGEITEDEYMQKKSVIERK